MGKKILSLLIYILILMAIALGIKNHKAEIIEKTENYLNDEINKYNSKFDFEELKNF